MKVSTKSAYDLSPLTYLALSGEEQIIPTRVITERWHIPIKYPEKLLKILIRPAVAGFLNQTTIACLCTYASHN